MLILAVVTINMIIGEDGIIKQAEESGDKFSRKAKIEQIMIDKGTELNASERRSSQEILMELAEKSVDYDIDPDILTVYYDRKEQQEYVVYRPAIYKSEIRKKTDTGEYDNTDEGLTERGKEELRIAMLRVKDDEGNDTNEPVVRILLGDCDGNGYLNMEDSNILDENNNTYGKKIERSKRWSILNFDNFSRPYPILLDKDANRLRFILRGNYSMTDVWNNIYKEGFSFETYYYGNFKKDDDEVYETEE